MVLSIGSTTTSSPPDEGKNRRRRFRGETADAAALLTRGNGNGQAGADSTEPAVSLVYESRRTRTRSTVRPRRATGPRIQNDEVLAVKRAETGAYLMTALGITAIEAAKRTGSNAAYIRAWRTIEQGGDLALMAMARGNAIALLAAEKSVKHLVAMRAAFAAASPSERACFFDDGAVKIVAAGLMTAEEHFKATVNAFGIDGTLDRLTTVDDMPATVENVS
jgi:hypothetical protein